MKDLTWADVVGIGLSGIFVLSTCSAIYASKLLKLERDHYVHSLNPEETGEEINQATLKSNSPRKILPFILLMFLPTII